MTTFIKETAEIKYGKIIVTTYGKRGNAVYPDSHIPYGIREAKQTVRQIESSTRELRPSTIARLNALKDGVAK
jgi:hypothetical protein